LLGFPKSNADLISFAKGIVSAMTGNVNFTTPSPALAGIIANITALELAQNTVRTGIKGSVANRDLKREALLKDLRLLNAYAQHITDNNPSNAGVIAQSSGFKEKQSTLNTKLSFEVKNTTKSGCVALIAKSIAVRAAYEWRMSIDGNKWDNLPTTINSRTTVEMLNPGTTYYFQFKSITKDGHDAWSQVLNLMAT